MTILSFDGARFRWLMLAAGIVVADQGVKRWAAAYLLYGASEPVTPFFNLVHVLNEGAAFSLLAGAGGWQRYFFIVLALVVSAGLVVLLLRGVGSTREAGGYSLVLGGALGNVVDRMVHGAVVDYLDFYLGDWHWPAFNLADTAIVLGVLLLLSETALSPRKDARVNHSSHATKT
jgi:signal peptidase II